MGCYPSNCLPNWIKVVIFYSLSIFAAFFSSIFVSFGGGVRYSRPLSSHVLRGKMKTSVYDGCDDESLQVGLSREFVTGPSIIIVTHFILLTVLLLNIDISTNKSTTSIWPTWQKMTHETRNEIITSMFYCFCHSHEISINLYLWNFFCQHDECMRLTYSAR